MSKFHDNILITIGDEFMEWKVVWFHSKIIELGFLSQ